jgi:hypothetical protein
MRRMRLSSAGFLILLVLASCTGSDQPGRFTYVVRYSVTGATGAALTVTYGTAPGVSSAATPIAALPWSINVTRDFDYDENPPFIPSMTVTGTSDGVPFDITIGYRDYASGFTTAILAKQTVSEANGVGINETLTGPVVPP